jgi:Sec-independent protein translocase protein TatA
MDSILGIGLPELVVIMLLAGLVMGPQRMRHFARKLGRLTADLQRTSRQLFRQLNSELDALDPQGELKSLKQDIGELKKDVETLALRDQNYQKALQDRELNNRSRLAKEPPFKPVSARGPSEDPGPRPSSLPRPLEVADDPDD